jgi:hypothetical protein
MADDYEYRDSELEVERKSNVDRISNLAVSSALPGGTGRIIVEPTHRSCSDPVSAVEYSRKAKRTGARQTRSIVQMVAKGYAVEVP